MKSSEFELRRHDLGFEYVHPTPTTEELSTFYRDQYFQSGQYSAKYTEEELRNKQIDCEECLHFASKHAPKTYMDLGCGEGFVVKFLHDEGWDARGVDFTSDGLKHHNPEVLDRVVVADVFETIDQLLAEGRTFGLLSCNNVLEHVAQPLEFLSKVKRLLAPNGVIRITVPNDGSIVQRELVSRQVTPKNYWVCPPAHLSYFEPESFQRVLEDQGFRIESLLASFPIDFFLFNESSNYVADRSRGKGCHHARVRLENMLRNHSLSGVIAFRQGCASAGVGRNITAYCTA